MDWICYIFKRGQHFYLVSGESLDEAWKTLSRRQSCSVKNCKKWYKIEGYMNGNSEVVKL